MNGRIKLNDRIKKKIKISGLKEPVKEFIEKILEIELTEGKGARYSKSYQREIEKAYVLLNRGE